MLKLSEWGWLLDYLLPVCDIAIWVVPAVTFLLLLLPNENGGLKVRLAVAAVASVLWFLDLGAIGAGQEDILDSGGAAFAQVLRDSLGNVLTLRLLSVLATVGLLLTFRPYALMQAFFGFAGCLVPIVFVAFMGAVLFLCFCAGMVICPVVWLVTVLLLLGGIGEVAGSSSSTGGSGGGGSGYSGRGGSGYSGGGCSDGGGSGYSGSSVPSCVEPDRTPSYTWEERQVPYDEDVTEPYTVTLRKPYEEEVVVERRGTEVLQNLLLTGDAGSLTITPEQSPYTMMGLKYAPACTAAPMPAALLYKLTTTNKGALWMLAQLPGHAYELLVDGVPAAPVIALLPGMKLSLKDAAGTELGLLEVGLKKAVRVVTYQERRTVTKYRSVQETRYRTRKVTKYRTERVRVPC